MEDIKYPKQLLD